MAAGTGAEYVTGTAGETVSAGQPVYLKASDSRYWKADANASAEASSAVAIMLHGADAGQPIKAQSGGQITIGGTVAVGTTYIVSATAGGIAPISDLASGSYNVILGTAITTGIILMNVFNSGVQKP